MKKKLVMRIFSFALSALLLAGSLPVSAITAYAEETVPESGIEEVLDSEEEVDSEEVSEEEELSDEEEASETVDSEETEEESEAVTEETTEAVSEEEISEEVSEEESEEATENEEDASEEELDDVDEEKENGGYSGIEYTCYDGTYAYSFEPKGEEAVLKYVIGNPKIGSYTNRKGELVKYYSWDPENPNPVVTTAFKVPKIVTDKDGNEYTVTTIDLDALSLSNLKTTKLYIPNTVKKFTRKNEYWSYESGVSQIKEIEFESPNADLSISSFAFSTYNEPVEGYEYFDSLEKVILPNGLKYIDESTFYGCTKLKTIVFPSYGLEEIRYRAFENSGITSFVMPESVKRCAGDAFEGCQNLKSVDFGKTENYGWSEVDFSNCTSLTSVKIGKQSYIRSFENCVSLETLFIPEGVYSIWDGAFNGCTNLKSVTIPSTLSWISSFELFDDCTQLVLTVLPDSYGEEYAIITDIPYIYGVWPDAEEMTLDKVEITVEDVVYDSYGVWPEVTIKDGNYTLSYGWDYTYKIINAKNAAKATDAKAPTVIIKGKNNYSGERKVTFNILPKDINDDFVFRKGKWSYYTNEWELTYNGKVQKTLPGIGEKYSDKTLKKGVDYDVAFPSTEEGAYKECGSWPVVVTAKGNYTGVWNCSIYIHQKYSYPSYKDTRPSASTGLKVSAIPAQDFTGNPIEPAITVKDSKGNLVTGVNIDYCANVIPGTANVSISSPEYKGVKWVTFKINGEPTSKIKINGLEDKEFTGSVIKNNVTFTWNGRTFTPDELATCLENGDGYYTGNHLNESLYYAGKYTYSATYTYFDGKKYKKAWSFKKVMKITPYDIKADSKHLISAPESISASYIKGGTTAEVPEITFNGKKIRDSEFKVSYKNNKAISSSTTKQAYMVLTGIGNYKGTIEIPMKIYAKNLGEVEISVKDVVYSETPGKFMSVPVLQDWNGKALVAGVDYDKNLLYYNESTDQVLDKNSVPNVGDVISVVATGINNYQDFTSASFRVTKKSLSKLNVTVANKTYKGELKTEDFATDDFTIKDGTYKLVLGVDFEIVPDSIDFPWEAGTKTFVIRGINNYGGVKTVKVKVVPKAL